MALIDLVPPRPALRLGAIQSRLAARHARPAPGPADGDDARSRRAFVQNMLNRNPEAFASAHDVQQIMGHYGGRF